MVLSRHCDVEGILKRIVGWVRYLVGYIMTEDLEQLSNCEKNLVMRGLEME